MANLTCRDAKFRVSTQIDGWQILLTEPYCLKKGDWGDMPPIILPCECKIVNVAFKIQYGSVRAEW